MVTYVDSISNEDIETLLFYSTEGSPQQVESLFKLHTIQQKVKFLSRLMNLEECKDQCICPLCPMCDTSNILQDFADFICETSQLFSLVDVSSCKTDRNLANSVHSNDKKNIVSENSVSVNHIAITTDSWTARKYSQLAVTCHWIDLLSKVLCYADLRDT